MRRRLAGALAVSLLTTLAAAVPATAAEAREKDRTIVIGHRGASGYRPEHTLAAYRLAIAQGAHFVEPDLVSTSDGVLVARHENEISGTTDVSTRSEFAGRRTTKTIDGVAVTGWFTEDFTLAELKRLRAVERLPAVRPGNTAYNGLFEVPTLQEVIDLVKSESRARGTRIGIYPETKHPTYFQSIGLPLEEPLVRVLKKNRWDSRSAPVYIQSFETANLRKLNRMTGNRLVQLLQSTGAPYDLVAAGDPRTYRDLVTPEGLRWVARYADGAGLEKALIIPRDANGALTTPTTVVRDAHRAGLTVHSWTFRSENQFLPADFRIGTDPVAHGNYLAEYRVFVRQGVDGVFSDFPDHAVRGVKP
jgi:glycerophosphoryl diester phosphodiesterase